MFCEAISEAIFIIRNAPKASMDVKRKVPPENQDLVQAADVATVDTEVVVHLVDLNAKARPLLTIKARRLKVRNGELRKETVERVHCLHATTAAERFFFALPSFMPMVQALGSA